MDQYPVVNNRTVIVTSSKDNSKYKQLIEMLTNNEFTNKLIQKNINIMENVVDDKNIFELTLYDYNMQPIQKIMDVTNNLLQQIIDIFDKLQQPKNSQESKIKTGGGEIDYKYKYEKYKLKYKDMTKVIVNYKQMK